MPKHHRHSIRLNHYDYFQPGAYFITICTHNRKCMLGNIVNGEMRANKFGRIIETEWLKTPQIRKNVELDEYVVMPNHFHAILFIIRRGVLQYAPTNKFRSPSQTIGSIVRGFKSAVTKRTNKLRNTPGIPVWQRNYYERVVRNENELNRIREYIQNNPLKWELDRENPKSENFNLDHDLYWREIYER
ncbi:MAG: transposase [bacterium (Candidatus Stahlbacteria) CG08_land_8_20_14_0_20_40_26]|nr:MAG: transposase [bacterium (Candidatus Stahlbacteria) CG23_combo_of_CG06-09_8_20_14_all_40_9]PIS26620.1 MAG: transposase [bacterium (Candidatus Stahlbacteria) CG08_land_8_20_14_0_20_40_26]